MEQGDVLDTEEAVAAAFAFGGPAASYRNQWLCVKAAFTQKNGIVFLGTALGAKSVAAKCTRQGNAAAHATIHATPICPRALAFALMGMWNLVGCK